MIFDMTWSRGQLAFLATPTKWKGNLKKEEKSATPRNRESATNTQRKMRTPALRDARLPSNNPNMFYIVGQVAGGGGCPKKKKKKKKKNLANFPCEAREASARRNIGE